MKKAFTRNLRDAALTKTIALPSAAGSVVTAVIDTGIRTDRASFLEEVDAVMEVPALPVAVVSDAETVTLIVEASPVADFASGVVTLRTLVATGAGGAGIPVTQVRTSLPTDLPRYVRGKVTTGAGTSDASAYSGTFTLRR